MGHDQRRIFILSGAYDDHHLRTRSDDPVVCTSAGKRLMLYKAIAEAAGSPPILLSPQPRGRGKSAYLPAVTSRFGEFNQLFSAASGVRKIRFFVDMVRYAGHVHRHTRKADTIIFDNYELIYVLAIYWCRLLGRKNRILLEYEDGKHEIDRGYPKLISGLAEKIGRRLVEGAILATPSLGERLPRELPTVLVPGILRKDIVFNPAPIRGIPVHFIYSGSLDVERGLPLLLNYFESSLMIKNTVYHITGQGHYGERFLRLMENHPGKIHFYGCVSEEELNRIRSNCHFGLNLQSSSNPISNVTFPSKTFDYLNAGLRVVSTRAAQVEDVLGKVAIYLQEETPQGLASAIQQAASEISAADDVMDATSMKAYSFSGTVERLEGLLAKHR